jgi:hypothetical protein
MGGTKSLGSTSRIPGNGREFFPCFQTVLNPPSSLSEVMNVISREVKRLEHESYHSQRSSAEI